jgi:predicted neuraminidase
MRGGVGSLVLVVPVLITLSVAAQEPVPGVLSSEMIFTDPPHPQCHASTLAEVEDGLVAAWFGGTREKHPDVGIWVARHGGDGWSEPREVATGEAGDGERQPTWNPVLFRLPDGALLLFYKVGPSPSSWWGMVTESHDGGRTFGTPRRLPDGILGPIKNKPVRLEGGTLLAGSSTESDGWRVHFERSADGGRTFERSAPPARSEIGAIQPTLLVHRDGRVLALCRSRQGRIAETVSHDGGATWSPLVLGSLPNPNSGIDGVTLADGRFLLVYNHTTTPAGRWGGSRSRLQVAISEDGATWQAAVALEDHDSGEYSYPAVIQTGDGLVHVTYTHRRTHIAHVVLDPARLVLRSMPDGQWPD